MKIHLDNVNLNSRSGPNSFASRLSNQLLKWGHQVVHDGRIADISLVFIEKSGMPLAKKVVHRLDGIWFSPNQFHTHNINIKDTYEKADHVIWQSEFDKQMTTKWWSLPKSGSVIRNGASFEFEKDIQLQEKIQFLKQKHEKIFVCSANWHPQKRLQSNIDLFLHLKERLYPTSCLIVMGSNPGINKTIPDLYATGNIPHNLCMQIYEACDWMFHLAWLDHCPNTVVEALMCKLPVICSSSGGTKELIQDYGLVLNEKSEYDFSLVDYDNPPTLNVAQIESLPSRDALGEAPNLSIEKSVKMYLDVFEYVMKEK